MKKNSVVIAYILALALYGHVVKGLVDCANLTPEPKNLSLLKHEIEAYHDSGAWEKSIACVMQDAKVVLQKYIPVGKERLAVIFDIDETMLSNWYFLTKMGYGYDHDLNKNWEFSAKSTAIKPVQDLYDFAKDNGFAIFFITGRRENQRESTARNLNKFGIDGWTGLYFKPMNYNGARAKDFKALWRAKIQNCGYTIVANIGDQESDLVGCPEALHNFKIPNPAYMIP